MRCDSCRANASTFMESGDASLFFRPIIVVIALCVVRSDRRPLEFSYRLRKRTRYELVFSIWNKQVQCQDAIDRLILCFDSIYSICPFIFSTRKMTFFVTQNFSEWAFTMISKRWVHRMRGLLILLVYPGVTIYQRPTIFFLKYNKLFQEIRIRDNFWNLKTFAQTNRFSNTF